MYRLLIAGGKICLPLHTCMAEGVCQIHIAPFFVRHTKTVRLQQHSLQSLGRYVELLYKDRFQRFVVCFHVNYVTSIHTLAHKHYCEQFLFHLGVARFCTCKSS